MSCEFTLVHCTCTLLAAQLHGCPTTFHPQGQSVAAATMSGVHPQRACPKPFDFVFSSVRLTWQPSEPVNNSVYKRVCV